MTAKTAKAAKEPRQRSATGVATRRAQAGSRIGNECAGDQGPFVPDSRARLCQPPAVGRRPVADRCRGSAARCRPLSYFAIHSVFATLASFAVGSVVASFAV